MYKTDRNLTILTASFAVCLVLANILAAKVVQIGFIEIPAAVILYPITFLCTDIIGEIWGKKQAAFTVRLGIIIQVIALVFIFAAILLPPAPYMAEFQESYAAVLGGSARFVIASLAAALVSQNFDLFAFHLMKEKFPKQKWLRNNTTIVSQLIDTTIFIVIAFIGTVPNLLLLIGGQLLIKLIIALCDTPVFYFLTRHGDKSGPEK